MQFRQCFRYSKQIYTHDKHIYLKLIVVCLNISELEEFNPPVQWTLVQQE